MRKRLLWIDPFLFLVAVDQWVKWSSTDVEAPLIPGLVSIAATKNYGFSLGMLGDASWLAAILSSFVIIAIILLLIRSTFTKAMRFAMLMILSGAFGNLLDRLFFGYVRDMFRLDFIQFYIFNPADIWITLGCILAGALILTGKADAGEK